MEKRSCFIIILNYNSATDVINLLQKLSSDLNSSFGFIVLDNFSQNIDRVRLKQFAAGMEECRIVHVDQLESRCVLMDRVNFFFLKHNYGYSVANNFALRMLKFNNVHWAFLINPDIEVMDLAVFPGLLRILEREKRLAILGPIVVDPLGRQHGPFERPFSRSEIIYRFTYPLLLAPRKVARRIHRSLSTRLKGYYRVYSVVGAFLALQVDLLAEVGYFDERIFLYIEEQIISERLRRRRNKVGYCTQHVIRHNHILSQDYTLNPEFKRSYSYYIDEYLRPTQARRVLDKLASRYFGKVILVRDTLIHLLLRATDITDHFQ